MSTSPLLSDPIRAWAAYEPSAKTPWDLPRVAHLHRRAGFAAPWSVLQRDLKDGPARSIDRLLNGEATSGDGQSADEFDALLDEMALRIGSDATPSRLQGLWLYRMILTARPLRERMTLFWHNHFATSLAKVENPVLMQRQNALLREHALGNFRSMLADVGKDPAMLVWLDASANRKAKPNENYAREVMELFTLGRGRYTEKDIREAARAFTGWFVVRDRFSMLPTQHDDGVKTIFGKTGRFRGEDVPSLLLDQPACAEFLAGKLYRQFVSEVDPPSPALLAPLAQALRSSDYDIAAAVRAILRSNLFFDESMRRRRVKSPVELAVGTVRSLEILRPTVSSEALAESTSRMGQTLYAPPSVAGWDGGATWINTTAMLNRTNLALALLGKDDERLGGRCDAKKLAAKYGVEPKRFYVDLLVQDALDSRVLGPVKEPAEIATLVLTTPEYQLA
ncbi:MAG TPA: DUF1800 domain-containing protein [Isosphaeraceae bacterium]